MKFSRFHPKGILAVNRVFFMTVQQILHKSALSHLACSGFSVCGRPNKKQKIRAPHPSIYTSILVWQTSFFWAVKLPQSWPKLTVIPSIFPVLAVFAKFIEPHATQPAASRNGFSGSSMSDLRLQGRVFTIYNGYKRKVTFFLVVQNLHAYCKRLSIFRRPVKATLGVS